MLNQYAVETMAKQKIDEWHTQRDQDRLAALSSPDEPSLIARLDERIRGVMVGRGRVPAHRRWPLVR